ncbi:hypothetical protein KB893_013050 [Coralloluteibacterium stylophorae]|uniref:Thioredoxin domain-containing protein n=1 Tax=Coralloluteibacterium stylophorae TaxID=1776034 RepID=A0AAP2CCT3_9GAMM|nr:hypothetical protein [Coralloluteibacterium stylophorae]
MPPASPADANRRSGRRVLIILFVLFFGGAFVAGALRFSGWQPGGNKANGQLLEPPVDLRELPPQRLHGGTYGWDPAARTWRILVQVAGPCDDACAALARDMVKVWELMGRRADHVDVLWQGEAPAGVDLPTSFVRIEPEPLWQELVPMPIAGSPAPVHVIDPNGFVILRYRPGFDVAGLRADLATLLKLK